MEQLKLQTGIYFLPFIVKEKTASGVSDFCEGKMTGFIFLAVIMQRVTSDIGMKTHRILLLERDSGI